MSRAVKETLVATTNVQAMEWATAMEMETVIMMTSARRGVAGNIIILKRKGSSCSKYLHH
ncbi:MAG: hypothetical protein DRG25_03130 [Deltaproteobacteria bacterium]|nr:MAG: hypothetical protein DRG25_03130 [Deltaproteobacteria bacterium]